MFYTPTLTVFILLVPVVVLVLLGVSVLFAPRQPDAEKVSAYDCGMMAIGHARSPFPVAYYVVAMLFLVFDIEVLLLYPVALCLASVQQLGFWTAIAFLLVLTVGFVFEVGSGALYFTHQRSRS